MYALTIDAVGAGEVEDGPALDVDDLVCLSTLDMSHDLLLMLDDWIEGVETGLKARYRYLMVFIY